MATTDRPCISDQAASDEGETDDDINNSENEETLKVMKKLLERAKVALKQGKKRKNDDEHSTAKKEVKTKSTRHKSSREIKRWENDEVIKLLKCWKREPACGMFLTKVII